MLFSAETVCTATQPEPTHERHGNAEVQTPTGWEQGGCQATPARRVTRDQPEPPWCPVHRALDYGAPNAGSVAMYQKSQASEKSSRNGMLGCVYLFSFADQRDTGIQVASGLCLRSEIVTHIAMLAKGGCGSPRLQQRQQVE